MTGSNRMAVDGVLKHLGLEFHCPAIACQCRIGLTQSLQGRAQIVVRLGVVGLDLDRLAVAGFCLGKPTKHTTPNSTARHVTILMCLSV